MLPERKQAETSVHLLPAPYAHQFVETPVTSSGWREQMNWSEPLPLPVEDIIKVPFIIPNRLSHELGTEPSNTLSEPLKTVEMTCGSVVEEHFWPIRYQIRHQQLQPYENAIEALKKGLASLVPVLHALGSDAAHEGVKIVAWLTDDLASLGGVSASSLSSFLDECRGQRERLLQLWELVSPFGLNNELMEDAIWEGNLIIFAVFYEILTSKADLKDVATLQGGSAQFVLDLTQDAIRTHPDFFHILVGGAARLRGTRRAPFKQDPKPWASLQRQSTFGPVGCPSPLDPTFHDMGSVTIVVDDFRNYEEKQGSYLWRKLRGYISGTSQTRKVYEIAKGLQYLHSQDIAHGDLRAANILIDDDDHVRLADFGLTRFSHAENASTNRGGSTRWMAPELLHPASCGLDDFERTPASDIYSFACVMLELYTGQRPFSEISSDAAVLLKVIAGERPKCPAFMHNWARELVLECWSHTPMNRPGTGAIIEAAVQVIRGERCIEPYNRTPNYDTPNSLPISIPAPRQER
ncbi:Kinase-like protein [Mycena venus]|uniref:Kinase-like protein n=1 Tax=Mycena venus TaxID=2733690 RepID=A0A8H6Z0Y7_9AGAR|nr:Kinase-like protein [Mycena venus]